MISEQAIISLRKAVEDIRTHQHQEKGEDLFCLNLTCWLGERMGPVLDALSESENSRRALVAELAELHSRAPALPDPAYGKRADYCEHCNDLCHSYEGLSCDDEVDGKWPCATMVIVEKYR